MGVFGKLFDPSGGTGGETGKGERYDEKPEGAQVDLDAGVLILPEQPATGAAPGTAEPTGQPQPGHETDHPDDD